MKILPEGHCKELYHAGRDEFEEIRWVKRFLGILAFYPSDYIPYFLCRPNPSYSMPCSIRSCGHLCQQGKNPTGHVCCICFKRWEVARCSVCSSHAKNPTQREEK
jgi:hypothetical protein